MLLPVRGLWMPGAASYIWREPESAMVRKIWIDCPPVLPVPSGQ